MAIKFGIEIELIDKISAAMGRISKSLDKLKHSHTLLGQIAGFLTDKVTMLAIAFGVLAMQTTKAIKSFAGLELKVTDVVNLIGGTREQVKEFTKEILSLGKRVPKPLDDLASSLFDVKSAGIETSKMFDVLEASTKLAVAGSANLKDTTKGLVSILAAYGLGAENAEMVSNNLFKSQVKGITTIQELSENIGRVSGNFANLGIPMEEMFATISTLTQMIGNTDIAVTSLRGVLMSILAPSAESAEAAKEFGVQWNIAGIKAKGFTGLLEEAKKIIGDNADAQTKLTGDARALTAVFSLLGKGSKNFAINLEYQKSKIDVVGNAYKLALETMSSKTQLFKNAWTKMWMEFVGAASPAINGVIDLSTKAIPKISNGFKWLGGEIKGAFLFMADQAKEFYTAIKQLPIISELEEIVIYLKNTFNLKETYAGIILFISKAYYGFIAFAKLGVTGAINLIEAQIFNMKHIFTGFIAGLEIGLFHTINKLAKVADTISKFDTPLSGTAKKIAASLTKMSQSVAEDFGIILDAEGNLVTESVTKMNKSAADMTLKNAEITGEILTKLNEDLAAADAVYEASTKKTLEKHAAVKTTLETPIKTAKPEPIDPFLTKEEFDALAASFNADYSTFVKDLIKTGKAEFKLEGFLDTAIDTLITGDKGIVAKLKEEIQKSGFADVVAAPFKDMFKNVSSESLSGVVADFFAKGITGFLLMGITDVITSIFGAKPIKTTAQYAEEAFDKMVANTNEALDNIGKEKTKIETKLDILETLKTRGAEIIPTELLSSLGLDQNKTWTILEAQKELMKELIKKQEEGNSIDNKAYLDAQRQLDVLNELAVESKALGAEEQALIDAGAIQEGTAVTEEAIALRAKEADLYQRASKSVAGGLSNLTNEIAAQREIVKRLTPQIAETSLESLGEQLDLERLKTRLSELTPTVKEEPKKEEPKKPDLGFLKIQSIPKAATGGIITNDSIVRVGEGNKKEAIIPLETKKGKAALDQMNGGGSSQNITLMIDGIKLAEILANKQSQVASFSRA